MSHFTDEVWVTQPHTTAALTSYLCGFLCSCLDSRVRQVAGLSLAQSASVKGTLSCVTILGSSSPRTCTWAFAIDSSDPYRRAKTGIFCACANREYQASPWSRREGARWLSLVGRAELVQCNEKWRIRVRYPGFSTHPCLKSRARIPNDHYRAVHQAERLTYKR